MTRALITGGLGFLGSHLTERLLEEETQIGIIDNLSTNAVEPDFFEDYSDCSIALCPLAGFLPTGAIGDFDTIFHLASPVGPAGVLAHAGEMAYKIIKDTKTVIDFALEKDADLILISTSEVYGRDGIFTENVRKIIPGQIEIRTEYGAGKLLAEIMTINKARVSELRYHIIRPFNIAGPRQKPDGGFVLPRFVTAALKNEPISVFGSGTQQRAFTHVLDIVDGILKIARSEEKNEIWNIGNIENMITIGDLAHLVKNKVKSESEIDYVNPKEIFGKLYAEAFDKLPNIGKIQERLKWAPQFDLMKIVTDTIEFYRKFY